MRSLQSKGSFRKWAYSLPVLVLLILSTILLARGSWEVLSKERESSARVEDLEGKIALMGERNASLKDDIAYLGTLEGVEEEIRDKFDVSREGEQVVVIVEPKPEEVSLEGDSRPWYKRLWSAIMGR